VTVGHTGACSKIVERRPPSSLVNAVQIISILLHIAVIVAVQAAAYVYLIGQPW
jgi:hypothetical protein